MDHFEIPVRRRSNTVLDGFRGTIIDELAIAQSSASTIFQALRTQGYKGGYSSVRKFVAQYRSLSEEYGAILPGRWILMLLQGAITPEKVNDALEQKIPEEDAYRLVSVIRNGCLRERNYALSILAHFRGMPIRRISKLLAINRNTVTEAIKRYCNGDVVHILLSQYSECRRIYFSWDAASWHVSKRLLSEVDRINTKDYRAENNTPEIAIAPLPSCAQFLNVIESVFSGMARAIIHNSDYESVDECKKAINLYFAERNQHFKDHPKRAGNKIWGKERTPPVFSETNNCKDPIYR